MSEQSPAAVLERLIRELNDPGNQAAPDRIDVIQKQIQKLQREPSAWQIGLDFLNNPDAQIRFYGSLTLTIKVNADWDGDKVGEDRGLVNHLLEHVMSSYVRLAAIPDAGFVLQKLCSTLVAIFQKTNSAWALPVRHVLACTLVGRYIDQDAVGDMSSLLNTDATITGHQLRSILLLATTLAEEMSSSAGATKSHNIGIRVSNNANDVWGLLGFCSAFLAERVAHTEAKTSPYRLQVTADGPKLLELAKAMIELVPHWSEYVKIKSTTKSESGVPSMAEHLQKSLETFITLFDGPELADTILQSFTALEQTCHKLLHKTVPQYAEELIQSRHATAWLQQLVEGDFAADAIAYADFLEIFLGQVDVTTPAYLEEEQYVNAVGQAQKLLHCEGSAGVDDPVCQVALEIISSVVEGYGDWDDQSIFQDGMRALVTQSCKACLEKVQAPTSELSPATQTWDTDERAKFQDFRYDVQDFLQNAYSILGIALVEEIVRDIVSPDMDWRAFEGNLFGLLAFSDSVTSEPEQFDQYLDAIFSCSKWQSAIDTRSGAPERIRQIMIKFIAENTGYLQRHAEGLVSSLNFLFESLHVGASATAASKAIFTLCDTQRSVLAEALPHFMNSLSTISDLDSDARSRIFGSVSAIIQTLPNEQSKLQPLMQVLEAVQTEAQDLLNMNLDEQDLRIKATDILYTLAAIGKGLRSPSDSLVDTEQEADVKDGYFWIQGEGSSIQHIALHIYRVLAERAHADQDSLFVEATCDFLRSAFTEHHPSPFKFPSSIVLEVLDRQIHLSTPHPDVVLGTASSYLASVDLKDPESGFVILLNHVLQESQRALTLSKTDGTLAYSDFSAAALDFFGRLLPKWGQTWFSLPGVQQTAQIAIELGLALLNDNDTMTRRAAAAFFTAFLEASANSKIVNDPNSNTNMHNTIQQFGPSILSVIIRLLAGECARSELESLTEPLKRMVLRQPLMANKLIKEAVKEENGVLTLKAIQATKPEQRARFAAQVEMLRGARKTNEVVRGFWIDCKGSSFGYVT